MSNPTNVYYTITSDTDYVFPFAYLSPSHVKVAIDGVEAPFTLAAQNSARITSTGNIGKTLRIYRETSKDPIHTWEDGAVILGSYLNASTIQSIYIAEEAVGYAEGIAEEAKQFALDGVAEEVEEQIAGATAILAAQVDPKVAEAAGHVTSALAAKTAAEIARDLAAAKVAETTAAGAAQVSLAAAQVALAQAAVDDAEAAAAAAAGPAAAAAVAGVVGDLEDLVDTATGAASTASTHASTANSAKTGAEAARDATVAARAGFEAEVDNAETILNTFLDLYLGGSATEPVVDSHGNPLQEGALFFHTAPAVQKLKIWDGAAWQLAVNSIEAPVAQSASDITNDSAVTGENVKLALNELATLIAGKANTSHTQAISTITGLQAALDAKAASAHGHTIADVSGLQAALDAKAATADVNTALAGKAATSHGHAIADVTGLQAALDGKAASSHTHTIANVTGLQAALDGKAASSHTHAIADTTGLQAALDAKLASSSYTAADVLSKLLTVDGSGSGLDADKWKGATFTVSTSAPSGGADGDFWFEREA